MTSVCTHNSLSIVLIDDDDEHRDLLSRAITSAFAGDSRDVTVCAFRDPEQGLAELPADEQTVILIDYSLDGTTGTEWLADFVRVQAGPVILITSHGDETIARQAFQHGAADYLIKPDVMISPDTLRRSVSEALRRFRLESTNRTLATRLKRTNAELERKNERLAELTSIAHRFVDDVAHEFRTPLAVIKEFASILSDGIGGEVTTDQRSYLDFISTSARSGGPGRRLSGQQQASVALAAGRPAPNRRGLDHRFGVADA